MKNTEKQKSPLQFMYCVEDVRARRFIPPFLSENNQTAVRTFAAMANNEESLINRNPEDFRLWLVGNFDPCDGQIDVLDSREFIIEAVDLFQQSEQKEVK